jgi:GNAT superfamily N-acetyltransferase
VHVRDARPDDQDTALNILDAAMLESDQAELETLLVAVDDGNVVGALVLVDDRVDAIAVRRQRRGQEIGSVLVRAAHECRGRLVAVFDPDVRPFYESLGFTIRENGDGRFEGMRER